MSSPLDDEYFDKAFWDNAELYMDDSEADDFYIRSFNHSIPAEEELEFERRRGAFLLHMDMAKFYQSRGYKTILDILK